MDASGTNKRRDGYSLRVKVDYKLFDEEADLTLAAPCGLYCGNCTIFRAYFDRDRRKAEKLAKAYKCKVEQIRCSGCRTEPQFCWSEDCEFKKCTASRKIPRPAASPGITESWSLPATAQHCG